MKGFQIVTIFIFALSHSAKCVEVALDRAIDVTKIVDISCAYSDDYADFWAYGCPTTPSDDIYPDVTGFWTSCHRSCEIIYYGGLLPHPTKLRISTYIEGDTFVEITGKDKPEDIEFVHHYGIINGRETPTWGWEEFDLTAVSGSTASVLNFTLTSSDKGFVLIDRVLVDLGDQEISPIPLDTDHDDSETHWASNDCMYLDDYHDFWAFGCPAETEEENQIPGAVGYWSPCSAASCTIEHFTSPSIIPLSVTLRGYLSESASIKIVVPESNKELLVINGAENSGWIDIDQDLSSYQESKLDVILTHNGGTVILDALYFNFIQTHQTTTVEADTTVSETTSTSTSTTTTTPTTIETTTESAGPRNAPISLIMAIAFMLPALLRFA